MTNSEFHILMALADGDRHGYAIMREVEVRSEGQVKLGPGTLYGAVQRMLESGWIEESDGPEEEQGERRRYYRLSADGRSALSAEAGRLQQMVKLAQRKKILPARG
ncbi:MAG: helix-turn-helix transcriptional regulator [Acidobacteria bacterium]|nr:helix-turn-helix transcriptional regulator [Acidobacteriota bacterium]